MFRKTIAVDIDDVIADSTESLRLSVNERHGVNLTTEHYRIPGDHRRYYERVWELNGIGHEADYTDFDVLMTASQERVAIVEGAADAIARLKEKFSVIFITARPESWDRATREWFRMHFGEDIELHFSQGYFNETGKTKGQLCREFGAEWLIDDVPGNCEAAVAEGVGAILFGNDYGWHKEITVPEGVVRCKTWPEVVEHLANV